MRALARVCGARNECLTDDEGLIDIAGARCHLDTQPGDRPPGLCRN
jgi:hypothetical protein